MKKLLFTLVLTVATFSQTLPIFAQTDGSTVGLTISPAIVEIAGNPDSKHTAQITVTNTSDKAIPLNAFATSLILIDEEIDSNRRPEFDASSWMKLSKENMLLEPGQSTPVDVVIDIPAQANPGGHYAQIGFRVLSDTNFNENTNAKIIPEISAAFFITVAGDVNNDARLNTTSLVSSFVAKDSQNKLNFSISNYGNTHILPAPKVTILKDGKVIDQIDLQPQLILPNTIKQFSVDWQAKFGYGNYSARVETVYGSQNIPLSSQEEKFRIIPMWWQILLAVALLTPPTVILFRRRHIPNALKILAGKRIHFVGKSRYSRASSNDNKQKLPNTVDDVDSINQFLGEAPRKRMLTVPPEMQPKPSATPITQPVMIDTVRRVLVKTPDEPISKIPIAPRTSVTEYENPSNPASKTIIVQTSASTIIRQETQEEAQKPQSTRSEQVAKKAAKATKKSQKKKT